MPRLLDKQPVSPLDQKVFCPVKYRYIDLARCLECVRLVRVDDSARTRYVICDTNAESEAT